MATDINAMIDELLKADEESGLSSWEIDFVDSIDKQRRQYGDRFRLSEKQIAVLERCYNKL